MIPKKSSALVELSVSYMGRIQRFLVTAHEHAVGLLNLADTLLRLGISLLRDSLNNKCVCGKMLVLAWKAWSTKNVLEKEGKGHQA